MPRRALCGVAILVALLAPAVASAQAAPAQIAAARYQGTQFREGVVLLGFKPGIPAAQQRGVVASVGATESWTRGVDVHLLQVPAGQVMRIVAALQARPEVRYAEPDYLHHADGAPNDPFFSQQWGLQNSGQNVNGTAGTPGADERATSAWNVTTGTTSVVVAVLDSGVDYTHPDLAPNMWSNPGTVNGCAAGTHGYNVLNGACDPMDDDTAFGGHGTHVAGIIGAAGNNGLGVSGVNWTTRIMAVKWLNNQSSGFTSDLITAMNWVVQAKQAGVNVRVVNDSATWPGTAFSQALSDEIDALTNNDILFVTAAGNTAQNNNTTPRYPCSYSRPGEVCVAASDQTDHLWSSSNWGATTVNLAAPGVNIYSTLIGGTYGFISGGSMACAQVSGATALVLSMGYQQVPTLRASVLNSVDVLPALSGLVATGGRLNICKGISGCTSPSGPPVNTALPAISGAAQQGQTLSTTAGTWSGSPTSYAYQWNRCNSSGANCAAITGATATTYTLMAAADIGSTIRVTVTASNAYGSTGATSAPTAVVTSAPAVSWTVNSSISNGQSLCGTVQWQAFVSIATSNISSVGFYIDGALVATDTAPLYVYNLNTSVLSVGTHVLALAATATDGSLAYTSESASTGINCSNGISLVQSRSAQGSSTSSISTAFSSGNTAGNLIIAFVRMSTTSQTVMLSDSAGNTYVKAVSQAQASDGHQIFIFYAGNIKAGANTVRATFSSSNRHPWLAIYEYSGLGATNPLDQVAQAQGSGTTVSTGPTAATTSTNELVFAGLGLSAASPPSVTAGTGFAIVQQNEVFGGSNAADEQEFVSATDTYAGTFTLSSSANWSAVVATFAAGPPLPPAITTTSLPSGTANASYSATLAASGGTTPYTWSLTVGTLPAGLTLNASTGAISGTSTTVGTSNFTVKVTDSATPTAQSATQALSITMNPAPLNITTPALPAGTVSVAYNTALAASGGTTPYTWSLTVGTLPAGLMLNASTGAISGTPTTAGTSNFTVKVTDSATPTAQTATGALSITIAPSPTPVSITTASLASGTVNAAYTATLTATGGTTPYSWSLTVGTLPAGLTLNAGTGAISGTPTTAGTSNFTVQVADSTTATPQTATQALSITVNSAALAVTTSALAGGTVSTAYSTTLAASGGTTPYTWSLTVGTLPAGLTLNASTGAISGTPTTAGTSNFTVQVADSATPTPQMATKALSITVNPAPTPLSVTTASLVSGTVSTAYSATLAASGGTTPYSWSITVGTLPAGLTLNASTGAISGTPSTAGTSNFTVMVADSTTPTAQTATKALSITVNPVLIALVQANAVEGTGVASLSQAFAAGNTAGNLIIAVVRMSTTTQTVAVSDSAGNVYTQAVTQAQTTDGHQTSIFYASRIRGGANTVTAGFSSTNNHPWLAIYEYSGLTTLDRTAHAQGSSSTPNSGLTATTTAAPELVFAAAGLPSSSAVTVTAGAGYALALQDPVQSGSRAATEIESPASTGAYAGTFSFSGSANWSSVVATFKP